jgi:hypothetical protein
VALFKPKAVKLYERGDVDGLIDMLDAPLESQSQLEASRALILLGTSAAPRLVAMLRRHGFTGRSSQDRVGRATLVMIGDPALNAICRTIEAEHDPELVKQLGVHAEMVVAYQRTVGPNRSASVPLRIRSLVETRAGVPWDQIEALEEAHEP